MEIRRFLNLDRLLSPVFVAAMAGLALLLMALSLSPLPVLVLYITVLCLARWSVRAGGAGRHNSVYQHGDGGSASPQGSAGQGSDARLSGKILALLDHIPIPVILVDQNHVVRHANGAARQKFMPLESGNLLTARLRASEFLAALDRIRDGARTAQANWSQGSAPARWQASLAALGDIFNEAGSDGDAGIRPGQGAVAGLVLIACQDTSAESGIQKAWVDFIANASHELRTPLASLAGHIETLQGAARNDPEAQAEFLDRMMAQAGRMRELIDNLLALSRADSFSGIAPQDRINLHGVVTDACAAFAPVAHRAGVKLGFAARHPRIKGKGQDHGTPRSASGCGPARSGPGDRQMEILGDRSQLRALFDIVLDNALKYGFEGGKVNVSLHARKTTKEQTVFEVVVRDFGPGVRAADLPRLTQRFFRAETPSRITARIAAPAAEAVSAAHGGKRVAGATKQKKTPPTPPGTGLGLAIAQQIINRHKAALRITGPRDGGLRIAIQFPAAPSLGDTAPSLRATSAGNRGAATPDAQIARGALSLACFVFHS